MNNNDEAATAEVKKRTIAERSAETDTLAHRLRQVSVGQFVDYKELSRVAAILVDGACGALQSARRILMREDGIVFDVVRGEGLLRLDSVGVVASHPSVRRRINRAAHREGKRLATVKMSELDREKAQQYLAAQAGVGIIRHITGTHGQKKLIEKCANSSAVLNIGETIQALLPESKK